MLRCLCRQLLRIEHPPSLHHAPDSLRVRDVLEGIGIEQDDVSELPDLDRTKVLSGADGRRGFSRGNTKYFERWDTRVDERAQLSVQRGARYGPVRGVGAGIEANTATICCTNHRELLCSLLAPPLRVDLAKVALLMLEQSFDGKGLKLGIRTAFRFE